MWKTNAAVAAQAFAESRFERLIPILSTMDAAGRRRGPFVWEMLRANSPSAGSA